MKRLLDYLARPVVVRMWFLWFVLLCSFAYTAERHGLAGVVVLAALFVLFWATAPLLTRHRGHEN